MNYRIRTSILGLFSLLLFVWVFQGTLLNTSLNALQLLGAQVGVSVGVEPSSISKLAQELDAKAQELEMRELAVVEAEERIFSGKTSANPFFSVEWYVTFLAFLLLILVLLNFYLDFKHRQESSL